MTTPATPVEPPTTTAPNTTTSPPSTTTAPATQTPTTTDPATTENPTTPPVEDPDPTEDPATEPPYCRPADGTTDEDGATTTPWPLGDTPLEDVIWDHTLEICPEGHDPAEPLPTSGTGGESTGSGTAAGA